MPGGGSTFQGERVFGDQMGPEIPQAWPEASWVQWSSSLEDETAPGVAFEGIGIGAGYHSVGFIPAVSGERGIKADTSMLSRFFTAEGISFKKKRSALRTGPSRRQEKARYLEKTSA